MNNVSAKATNIRISPRKMGVVAGLVRGRTVADALIILEHTPRKAAVSLTKVIKSAAANAVTNSKLDRKTLQISTLQIANGTSMKRFRPAARGRALPYKHRSSNILVIVSGESKAPKTKPTADKTTKKSSNPDKKGN